MRISTFLIVIIIFGSCTDIQKNEPVKTDDFYVSKLVNDEAFKTFISKFSSLSDLKLVENSDSLQFQEDLTNISSVPDFENKIRKHFQEPVRVSETVLELFSISRKFQDEQKDFILLENTRRDEIIKKAVRDLITSEKRSLSKANISGRLAGQCEDELDDDEETCLEASIVAAGACGLTVPTFVGAIVCYSVVMAGDIACHRAAERSYRTCKKYN